VEQEVGCQDRIGSWVDSKPLRVKHRRRVGLHLAEETELACRVRNRCGQVHLMQGIHSLGDRAGRLGFVQVNRDRPVPASGQLLNEALPTYGRLRRAMHKNDIAHPPILPALVFPSRHARR